MRVKPLRTWVLILRKVRKIALKLHFHSVNYAAKLVRIRRTISSTSINSHQEPVSGQACNSLIPTDLFLFLYGGGVLRYPVPKWLLFLDYCWGVDFAARVV